MWWYLGGVDEGPLLDEFDESVRGNLPNRNPLGLIGREVWRSLCGVNEGPSAYRGTLFTRNRLRLGPYSRTMPRALWGSWEGGHFLMSEVPL